jgi:hypothetical protein
MYPWFAYSLKRSFKSVCNFIASAMCNRSKVDSDNKNGTRGIPRGAAWEIGCLSVKTCCESANSGGGLDAHGRVSFAVFGKKLF